MQDKKFFDGFSQLTSNAIEIAKESQQAYEEIVRQCIEQAAAFNPWAVSVAANSSQTEALASAKNTNSASEQALREELYQAKANATRWKNKAEKLAEDLAEAKKEIKLTQKEVVNAIKKSGVAKPTAKSAAKKKTAIKKKTAAERSISSKKVVANKKSTASKSAKQTPVLKAVSSSPLPVNKPSGSKASS